jgi:hypothetical protein
VQGVQLSRMAVYALYCLDVTFKIKRSSTCACCAWMQHHLSVKGISFRKADCRRCSGRCVLTLTCCKVVVALASSP